MLFIGILEIGEGLQRPRKIMASVWGNDNVLEVRPWLDNTIGKMDGIFGKVAESRRPASVGRSRLRNRGNIFVRMYRYLSRQLEEWIQKPGLTRKYFEFFATWALVREIWRYYSKRLNEWWFNLPSQQARRRYSSTAYGGGGMDKRVSSELYNPAQFFFTSPLTTWARLRLTKLRMQQNFEPGFMRYVPREGLERRITAHVNKRDPTNYLVICGPRGAGKSFIVNQVLAGRPKVAYVELTEKLNDTTEFVRRKLGFESAEYFDIDSLFKPFKHCIGSDKPVLVVEIEGIIKPNTVRLQAQLIKSLCVVKGYAHGILVLSDPSTAFELNQDAARQRFMWIDSFDLNELNSYLDKWKLLANPDEATSKLRKKLINEAGALPAAIYDVAHEAETAAAMAVALLGNDATQAARSAAKNAAERSVFEKYIDNKKRDACDELDNLLSQSNQKDKFIKLIKALVDNPKGVRAAEVHFEPETAIQETEPNCRRAITFNSESKVYQFYSKAHEAAAKTWVEKNKRNQNNNNND